MRIILKRLIDLYLSNAPLNFDYASIDECIALLSGRVQDHSIKMKDPKALKTFRIISDANDIWLHFKDGSRYSLLGIKQRIYPQFADFNRSRFYDMNYLYEYILKKNEVCK